MAFYRKFLQTFKEKLKKKGRRVGFREYLPFFKRSPKEEKKGHHVGVRDFSPLFRPSPMEKGHRDGMLEFLRK